MTLHKKGGERQFIFPAKEKISSSELGLLKIQEDNIELFEKLDREGQVSKSLHNAIFASYNMLNSYDIYKDKSINERIKRAIARLEKLMRKYNVRGTY